MTITIDVAMIPDCGDPGAVQSAAGELQGLAGTIGARGSLIHSTWQGMKGPYQAPEAGALVAATKPVQSRTEHTARNVSGAAEALTTYAEVLAPIKQKLDELKQQAQAFNSWAWAHPDWERHPELSNNTVSEPIPDGNARQRISSADAWHDKIVHEIAVAVAELQTARQQCASSILRYVDHDVLPPARPPTRDEAHDHRERYEALANYAFVDPGGLDFPWGSAFKVEAANPHPNFAQRFAGRFVGDWESMNNFFSGAFGYQKDGWGSLPGGHFTADTFTRTWKGIRDLGIATTGAGFVVPGAAYLGGKVSGQHGLASWGARNVARNATMVKELGKSLIGYEGWKQGPAEGLADVSFNAATMVTPGPVKLGGAMLAARGAALVEHAGAGTAVRFLGVTMQAPKFLNDGGLVWGDIRLGAKGASWAGEQFAGRLPSVRDFLGAHPGGRDPHPGVLDLLADADGHRRVADVDQIPAGGQVEHPGHIDDLEWALRRYRMRSAGVAFSERDSIWKEVVEENAQHIAGVEQALDPGSAHSVADAWHRLPESWREKFIEEATFQSGPADNAKDLPSEYWSVQDTGADPQAAARYAAALAELRAYPDALARYLVSQPLHVLLRQPTG